MQIQKNNKHTERLMPVRHSAEHIMAKSLEILFPGIKKVMGPAIDNGFYGDFDYEDKVSVEDLEKMEKEMHKIIKSDLPIEMREVSYDESRQIFADNPYKLELIEEIQQKGEKITVCEISKPGHKYYDIDLCSGGHVQKTGDVKAFKLLSVAGAYWRGSEKNKMLTRIYGTAFDSKQALEEHLNLLEEAKKRDHRKIGKELELFTFVEDVGPGLPLWLPNGAIIREELEKWGKETEEKWGYKRVGSPFLTKRELFETSGHIPYFEDEMYKVHVPGEEEEEYFIKPMNCPFHHMIYKTKPRSYKELPLRLAEYGTVARYENRGTLNGILRPRVFCQNDAHIYCTQEQAISVFVEIANLHRYYYDSLGLKDYYIVLCLRDPKKMDKYHGNEEMWQKSEELSKQAMDEAGIDYVVENEGAAHYGPKMDFKIKSAIGTEYGISTNQIDLFMPQRFNLTYTAKDGSEKPVVVQHRAPLGSDERFIGFLIEHFAGAFPVWLAPTQVQIIPIGDKFVKYGKTVLEHFREKHLRANLDDRDETMQSKIRDAQLQKIPYMLVVGEKEEKDSSASVRLRSGENLGPLPLPKVIDTINNIYLTKSLRLW